MGTTYRADGNHVRFTADADYSSGDGKLFTTMLGVIDADVANGDLGSASITGVHELPILASDNVAAPGVILYWDDGNSRLTTTASTHKPVAKSTGLSGVGVATVEARLCPELADS
jgi:predicted RecA/RadA family phage recombinase